MQNICMQLPSPDKTFSAKARLVIGSANDYEEYEQHQDQSKIVKIAVEKTHL